MTKDSELNGSKHNNMCFISLTEFPFTNNKGNK
jgi:hypothetical protein